MAVKISSKMCLNDDIGLNGNMFGGRLLCLMDEAAAIYAIKTTNEQRIVSRKFSGVEFKSPVRRGEILEFYADNPRKGVTSFSFDIIVKVGGVDKFSASCVFVATDEKGRKKNIDWSKSCF